jgi:hypothetical protein
LSIDAYLYLTGVPHRIRYFEELMDYIRNHDDVAFLQAKTSWIVTVLPKTEALLLIKAPMEEEIPLAE